MQTGFERSPYFNGALPMTYGTMKILSVHGSFTLLPGVYPLTSTYLFLESKGLTTYPGFSGTRFATGNCAEGCDGLRSGSGFVWRFAASASTCLGVVGSLFAEVDELVAND